VTLDEVEKRFVAERSGDRCAAYDDKYIDKKERGEILQIAIQGASAVDSARCPPSIQVAIERRTSSRYRVVAQLKGPLDLPRWPTRPDRRERVQRRVTTCRNHKGQAQRHSCKRMVVEIIEENTQDRPHRLSAAGTQGEIEKGSGDGSRDSFSVSMARRNAKRRRMAVTMFLAFLIMVLWKFIVVREAWRHGRKKMGRGGVARMLPFFAPRKLSEARIRGYKDVDGMNEKDVTPAGHRSSDASAPENCAPPS